ncbi:MAG: hypothetical protein AAF719_00210 [Pseudomonadota bacterium]
MMAYSTADKLLLAAEAARYLEGVRWILDAAEIYEEETREAVERALAIGESELLRWRVAQGLNAGALILNEDKKG